MARVTRRELPHERYTTSVLTTNRVMLFSPKYHEKELLCEVAEAAYYPHFCGYRPHTLGTGYVTYKEWMYGEGM